MDKVYEGERYFWLLKLSGDWKRKTLWRHVWSTVPSRTPGWH